MSLALTAWLFSGLGRSRGTFSAEANWLTNMKKTISKKTTSISGVMLKPGAFPGVRETLAALLAQGARLGICTNKPHALTCKLLRALDLERCFEAILGGDSLAVRKPDPGHLLGVVEALGAERSGAVMVGDSPIDVACARAAGVPMIAVSYGYSRVAAAELGADMVIERFAELPAALTRLA